MGRIVAIIRQAVTIIGRGSAESEPARRSRHSQEREQAVTSYLSGAMIRAILVATLAILPAVLLPSIAHDTAQIMILLALFVAALVFAEYASTYPGFVEFRFAAPYNRTRFLLVAATVVALTLLLRDGPGAGLSPLAAACAGVLDFAASPVALLLRALPANLPETQFLMVQHGAALAFTLGLATVLGFLTAIRMGVWPMGQGPFNVWINLPTFDPTAGSDVVQRLRSQARLNIVLGIILPFMMPLGIAATGLLVQPVTLESPLAFVWGIALWAYLPVALIMRGAAMGQVARMIRLDRRRLAGADPVELAA
jgi:hypothetical protein